MPTDKVVRVSQSNAIAAKLAAANVMVVGTTMTGMTTASFSSALPTSGTARPSKNATRYTAVRVLEPPITVKVAPVYSPHPNIPTRAGGAGVTGAEAVDVAPVGSPAALSPHRMVLLS